MERFIGLVLVGFCLASGVDLSSKAAVPSASNCSGYAEATLPQQLLLKAWMFSSSWTVQDLFFIRLAKTGHPDKAEKGDFMLVQLPFTGGTWYKL